MRAAIWKQSLACILIWAGLGSSASWAQNVGGIFPPMVQEDHSSLQYRITHAPSTDSTAQRVHYQQAWGSSLMWRLVMQASTDPEQGTQLQHGQGELFWDLSTDDSSWKRGLRLDARVRGTQDPGMVGLHWTNQLNLTERWSLRLVALTSMDIGSGAEADVKLQTRGSVFAQLDSGLTVGVEFYETYGTIRDLQPFSAQDHQIGPFAFIPVTDQIQLFTGVLTGMTEASSSLELRAWSTYTF